MKIIDLRSDTVTLPSPEMRQYISQAPLGDDVFNEDPTVNLLQEIAACKMGKEDAILVPSGTMANLVALLSHCYPGDEVILGSKAHIFLNESGGSSAVGGIHPRTVLNQPDGTILLEDIIAAIRKENDHYPKTRLIALENTHNYCNGNPLSVQYMDSVGELAKKHNLYIHLDGARIFNAAIALGADVKQLTRQVDSVSFCLSKGLAAPVGSLICGTREFISRARRKRKLLGGGMRQAGIIAAAGIMALENMVERLSEDHENARIFAESIAEIPGISLDPSNIKTNIVFFNLETQQVDATQFVHNLAKQGVKILALGHGKLRAVTHYGVSKEDIHTAIKAVKSSLST